MGCACGGKTARPVVSAARAAGAQWLLSTPDGKTRQYLTKPEAEAARTALGGIGTIAPA